MSNYAIGPKNIRKAIQEHKEPAINFNQDMQPEEESQAFYYEKEKDKEPVEAWSEAWDESEIKQTHPEMNMSFLDYTDKIKQEMGGDPYAINIQRQAKMLFNREEASVFNEFFQGKYHKHALPEHAAKAWSDLKEDMHMRALKQTQNEQNNKIRLYNHKIAEWQTVQNIRVKQLKEMGQDDEAVKVKGSLTDSNAISAINDMFYTPDEQRENIEQYLQYTKPMSQREALLKILQQKDTLDDFDTDEKLEEKLKEKPVKKIKVLTKEIAIKFLRQTKGDKQKARELAKLNGYTW